MISYCCLSHYCLLLPRVNLINCYVSVYSISRSIIREAINKSMMEIHQVTQESCDAFGEYEAPVVRVSVSLEWA